MITDYEMDKRAAEVGLNSASSFPYDFFDAADVDTDYMGNLGRSELTDDIDMYPYPDVEDARIAFIGACAGGLAASYLVQRGFSAANMHLIDPQGRQAGIWNTWLAEGGINNPKPLYFPSGHKLRLGNRAGTRMRDFVRGITDTYLMDAPYVRATAVDLRHSDRDNTWEVRTDQDDHIEADYVVISTGTPRPRRIDGSRIQSNLDVIADTVPDEQLTVERWQRTLTDEELSSGREIVMIGLGNSTGTLLRQIYDFQDRTGIKVPFTVVTDKSRVAVEHPKLAVQGNLSIFRKPSEGHFSGYSGDLSQDKDVYFRALDEGNIISGALTVNFNPKTGKLTINSKYQWAKKIETPHVFALVGYERDSTLFKSAGAQVVIRKLFGKQVEGPHIRPADGALWTVDQGYASNLFALGAAATTSENPSAGVMPKIVSTLPGLALTQATRENVRRRVPEARRTLPRR